MKGKVSQVVHIDEVEVVLAPIKSASTSDVSTRA